MAGNASQVLTATQFQRIDQAQRRPWRLGQGVGNGLFDILFGEPPADDWLHAAPALLSAISARNALNHASSAGPFGTDCAPSSSSPRNRRRCSSRRINSRTYSLDVL